jgi:ribosome-associated heat shock protein Hsp15
MPGAGEPGAGEPPAAVRIDRYLWSVRLVKTRSLATELCRSGHVKVNGASVKPAHPVHPGDRIELRHDQRRREIEVTALIERRVGAETAVACYLDHTPAVEPHGRVAPPFERDAAAGRPTKRDRRQLDRLRRTL